jgi:tetratricopeptide (TPR) repeat protein
MMFYAPLRGLRIVRDGAPLVPAAVIAIIAQSLYLFYGQVPQLRQLEAGRLVPVGGAAFYLGVFFSAALTVLLIAVAFVPIAIFVANFFERRGSFQLVFGQEYTSFASTVFYAWAAANLAALPLAFISRTTGFESLAIESVRAMQQMQQNIAAGGDAATTADPSMVFGALVNMLGMLLISPVTLFAIWTIAAVHEVFRFTWWRAAATVVGSGILMIPASIVLRWLFNVLFASIFLLIFVGIILRNYIGELTRAQRASAAFRQNLEAATLNPADASSHYNLGLIHLDRKEFVEARERFTRAVSIDAEEADAHYQLGRISRLEGKNAEAIEHFGQVVTRDQTHSQHELWREIGATYLAAEQYEDARDALERFLEHRASDPEGLYLMGRTLAAMGRQREAQELMQRCIEAVRSSPAYKYRMEKRWMSEAQAFLRSQA